MGSYSCGIEVQPHTWIRGVGGLRPRPPGLQYQPVNLADLAPPRQPLVQATTQAGAATPLLLPALPGLSENWVADRQLLPGPAISTAIGTRQPPGLDRFGRVILFPQGEPATHADAATVTDTHTRTHTRCRISQRQKTDVSNVAMNCASWARRAVTTARQAHHTAFLGRATAITHPARQRPSPHLMCSMTQ